MDKWQAIHEFWNSFGIPAYDENAVPEDAAMPYITYSAVVSNFENPIPLAGYIWYHSTRWDEASLKAEEIATALESYLLLPIGDGHQYLLLAQGSPFAQRMVDENDSIRRIYVNIMAEFLTKH